MCSDGNTGRIGATQQGEFRRNFVQFERIGWGRVLLSRKVVTLVFGLVLTVLPVQQMTATACENLRDGPAGTVVSVTDGDTVVLDNGLVVRLIGIQAPKLPLGREDFEAWPLADKAKSALEALVGGQRVRVRQGGETVDRHGRVLGQLFVEATDGVWVQQQMIAAGMARVYSFADNRACVVQLLAAEGKARLMRLGIWADPYYAVRRGDRPDDLARRLSHYELVEGRVLLADAVQGRVYLNFGRHFAEDFTVVIERGALPHFEAEGIDPTKLGGALVRVRGWVELRDGPRMEVTHPEQIEVLAVQ
jgi:micrococcal nuclease